MILRQDNADLRLTEIGRNIGLVSDARYDKLMRKREDIERARQALGAVVPPSEALTAMLEAKGESGVVTGVRLSELLKRNLIGYTDLQMLFDSLPSVSDEAREQVEIEAHYGGYIERENERIRRFESQENILLPSDLDYSAIGGLRLEARQKLSAQRPRSLGQASRISGVSPSDIAVLLIRLKALGLGKNNENSSESGGEQA